MCLYKAQISGEPLQDHWSSGFLFLLINIDCGFSLQSLNDAGLTSIHIIYVFEQNLEKNNICSLLFLQQ